MERQTLNDEQLHSVSGGTIEETNEIYDFIQAHDPQGYVRLLGELRGDLSAYFQSVGIDAHYIYARSGNPNVYGAEYDADAIANGTLKTYSHEQIMAMLKNRFPG